MTLLDNYNIILILSNGVYTGLVISYIAEPTFFWSAILSIGFALFSAILATLTKFITKKQKFHHFYYLIISSIGYIIGGLAMIIQPGSTWCFIITPIGHGISHVMILSYINIRLPALSLRSVTLSEHHIVYLIGIVVIVCLKFILSPNLNEMLIYAGSILMGLGSISFVLQILLVICEYYEVVNMSKSWDPLINKLNDEKQLLWSRSEIYENFKRVHREYPVLKKNHQFANSIVGICLKLQAASFLSTIFPSVTQFKFGIMTTWDELFDLYCIIFALAGTFLCIAILPRCSYQLTFIAGSVCMILFQLFNIFLSAPQTYNVILLGVCLPFYCISGFQYSIADCIIVERTQLKYTELMLAIGYTVEFGLMIALNYMCANNVIDLYNPYSDLSSSQMFNVLMILLNIIFISLIVIFITPVRYKRPSLIEIRNEMMGIKFNLRYFEESAYFNRFSSATPLELSDTNDPNKQYTNTVINPIVTQTENPRFSPYNYDFCQPVYTIPRATIVPENQNPSNIQNYRNYN